MKKKVVATELSIDVYKQLEVIRSATGYSMNKLLKVMVEKYIQETKELVQQCKSA